MLKNITVVMDNVAIAFITTYQKYLSPYKGFRCAYSVFHNADSCSKHIVNCIKKYGLIGGWDNIKKQFSLCSLAKIKLQDKEEKEKEKEKCCQPADICSGCSPISPALRFLRSQVLRL